jgi:hypothetical protein
MHRPLLHSAKVRGLTATILKPWGPKNSRVPLCTPTSTHIPTIAFPPSSSCLKKRERKRAKKINKGETRGRTSLDVLYSKRRGMSRR